MKPTRTIQARADTSSSSASSSDRCKGKPNEGDCQMPETSDTLTIVLAVVLPVVVILCVLGFFLWKAYQRDRKESLEHDPDFDENGEATALPDLPKNHFENPFHNRNSVRYPEAVDSLYNGSSSTQHLNEMDHFVLPYQHQMGSKASLDDYAKYLGHSQGYKTAPSIRSSSMFDRPPVPHQSPQKSNLRTEHKTYDDSDDSYSALNRRVSPFDDSKSDESNIEKSMLDATEDSLSTKDRDVQKVVPNMDYRQDNSEYRQQNDEHTNKENSIQNRDGFKRNDLQDLNVSSGSAFINTPEYGSGLRTGNVAGGNVNDAFINSPEYGSAEDHNKKAEYGSVSSNGPHPNANKNDPGSSNPASAGRVNNDPASAGSVDGQLLKDTSIPPRVIESGYVPHIPAERFQRNPSSMPEPDFDDSVDGDFDFSGGSHDARFATLKNESDNEDPEQMSAEQKEQLQRMKSVYKVYFDEKDLYTPDESQKLPDLNVSEYTHHGDQHQQGGPEPIEQQHGEQAYSSGRYTPEHVEATDARPSENVPRGEYTQRNQEEFPQEGYSQEGHPYEGQPYSQGHSYSQGGYSQSHQYHQDGQMDYSYASHELSQPYDANKRLTTTSSIYTEGNEMYNARQRQDLAPLQSLPNASDIRHSTLQTYTDFQPHVKNSSPTSKIPYDPLGGWNSSMDQSQLSLQSGSRSSNPSASQLARSSVVMINPVAEFTKQRTFKPAGSPSNAGSPTFGQSMSEGSDLIPGNRKSDVRRMMNTNF